VKHHDREGHEFTRAESLVLTKNAPIRRNYPSPEPTLVAFRHGRSRFRVTKHAKHN